MSQSPRSPKPSLRNYAFIDAQNLNLGVQRLGWKLDLVKFRRYLSEKYQVGKAYVFIGYLEENKELYEFFESSGYLLEFRQTVLGESGIVKGNVDVDLTVKSLTQIDEYAGAVIITSDGDFYPLVDHLQKVGKLVAVISPYRKTCSSLLKKSAKSRISFLDRLQNKLELKHKKNQSDQSRSTKKEGSD